MPDRDREGASDEDSVESERQQQAAPLEMPSTARLLDSERELSPQLQNVLKEVFARFDTDGDGCLSVDELQCFARTCNGGEEMEPEEIEQTQEYFDMADPGDRMTFIGFLQMWHTQTDARQQDSWNDLAALGYDRSLQPASASGQDPGGSEVTDTGGAERMQEQETLAARGAKELLAGEAEEEAAEARRRAKNRQKKQKAKAKKRAQLSAPACAGNDAATTTALGKDRKVDSAAAMGTAPAVASQGGEDQTPPAEVAPAPAPAPAPRAAPQDGCKMVLGAWNTRILAHDLRTMLAFAKVEDYVDKRYNSVESWLAAKDQLGLAFPSLPFLIDDTVRLTHHETILRYLGGKLGLDGGGCLSGGSIALMSGAEARAVEAAQAEARYLTEMAAEAVREFRGAFLAVVNCSYSELHDLGRKEHYLAKIVPQHAEHFDALLREMCPAHDYLVVGSLPSYADFALLELVLEHRLFDRGDPDATCECLITQGGLCASTGHIASASIAC